MSNLFGFNTGTIDIPTTKYTIKDYSERKLDEVDESHKVGGLGDIANTFSSFNDLYRRANSFNDIVKITAK